MRHAQHSPEPRLERNTETDPSLLPFVTRHFRKWARIGERDAATDAPSDSHRGALRKAGVTLLACRAVFSLQWTLRTV